jgi:hypothetical protein
MTAQQANRDAPVLYLREIAAPARWMAGLLIAFTAIAPASGQVTQPIWYPPLSLYGRPVAQPYFDFPTWARYSGCRPAPLAWGYDPFPNYGPCEGEAACYPSVACPGDFVAHRPSDWYATADFAPLMIDHLNGYPVARLGPTLANPNRMGRVVLSTEDLEPEFAAGGEFTVGRRIFDCYRLEATYLGKHDWDANRRVDNQDVTAAGLGSLSTFLGGFRIPPAVGLDGNNLVAIAQRSTFQSAEVNLRYWADMPPGPFDVSYLIGARYLQISEQFAFFGQTTGAAEFNDLLVNTQNDMIGLQIGIEGAFLVTTRWWVDVDLKGGIYNNSASHDTSLISTVAGIQNISDARDATAFVGDISLVANWAITPNWTFRIGYQALFVNGVALAHEQNTSPLFQNTPGSLNDAGEICYHGPIVGLTWMR